MKTTASTHTTTYIQSLIEEARAMSSVLPPPEMPSVLAIALDLAAALESEMIASQTLRGQIETIADQLEAEARQHAAAAESNRVNSETVRRLVLKSRTLLDDARLVRSLLNEETEDEQ